jgi:predicted transcriptional regulator
MLCKLQSIHKFVKVADVLEVMQACAGGDDAEVPTEPVTGQPRDADAVAGFIERFANALIISGVPRMPARVFVALLATDSGRRTAAELAALLHASPAAISGAVRYLTQVRMINRGREPGSRRDHYEVVENVWYEVILSRDQDVQRWQQNAEDGAHVLGRDTAAGQRMWETAAFFEFLEDEMPAMLKRWREHRSRLRARWAAEG